MPRPACAPPVLTAPLFIYKTINKYRQSFRHVRPDLVPHCLQTKHDREDAPTHPLAEIPGIAHERQTRIKSGGPGPLTIAVFLFNDPPPQLFRSYEDGTTALSVIRLVTQRQILLLFFKSFYVCVCVGGGGPVTSFTFRNSRGV